CKRKRVNPLPSLFLLFSLSYLSNCSKTSLTISLSSKWYLTPFISWYFSCPFPAISTISSALARLIAVLIASFLSTIEMYFLFADAGNPCSISLLICAGSSLLGLSLVKIALSLCSHAASAIVGLFLLSLSPPQPTTVITFSNPFLNLFIVSRTFR